jgi:toxin-antitoxin system PIN domain toxin
VSGARRAALLDVNVLIALFDPDHVHHEIAHDWFADHRELGWATCPLTENGFLRAASVLPRSRELVTVPALAESFRRFRSSGHHEFWPDDLSILEERLFNPEQIRGHQQVTDVYLLGLAVKHQGVLATFDQKIPVAAVKGATRESLEVIARAE